MKARTYLGLAEKQALFSKYSPQGLAKDTGSVESQVALFSKRITHLSSHLKVHKGDHGTRLNLLRMVGKRRRLLDYLKDKDLGRYRALIKDLSLRR